MTEKLYYQNAYLKDFCATVTACEKTENGYAVVLDKTAFFPEEGGQYSDKGTIGGVRIFDVVEKDGIIYHKAESALEVGGKVYASVDFDERFEKMQCHTAEHILSGLIHKHFGLDNVGFHLGAEDVTMDISAPLEWEQLMQIEAMANNVVFENVRITEIYPTADELPSLEYRSKLDITENVRIVNIGEYDSCACCAPHVRYTGEIGSIKILDTEKLRGGMRIHITAGKRAYAVYGKMYENLSRISHLFAVPRLETAEAAERFLSAFEAKKAECKQVREAYYEREGQLVCPAEKNLILRYDSASYDELRTLANSAVKKVGGILVLLSGADGDYKYILASESVDLRVEVKKINAALGGKGGGSPIMAQGSFSCTLAEIERYFI